MTERQGYIPEIVNDGGITGINPYFLEWAYDFLNNYGLPKEWEEDEDFRYYFAPNIWGNQGLWLGTNIAEPITDYNFLIAKAPSNERVEVAVIQWRHTNGNSHTVWWDKRLTPDDLTHAMGIMDDRTKIQEEVFGEKFDELSY